MQTQTRSQSQARSGDYNENENEMDGTDMNDGGRSLPVPTRPVLIDIFTEHPLNHRAKVMALKVCIW